MSPAGADRVVRAGTSGAGPLDLVVTPESAGWERSGLRVLTLEPDAVRELTTGDAEVVVISLGGSARVDDEGGASFALLGRGGVFDGPSDVVYLPPGSAFTVSSPGGGRFAVCSARCPVGEGPGEPYHLAAADVPVELRGAGAASRQVHNFGVPGVLAAGRIIACEVITPGGNWSSWPPHRHDRAGEHESALEEIYYYEVAPGPGGEPGVGYQQVSGIGVTTEIRSGDVILVPHGWHGPSIAAPGNDLYYLNVMAGPERAWRITDDPAHAWVRGTWPSQPVDPRLPLRRSSSPHPSPSPHQSPYRADRTGGHR
ncbi:5-deoxy-glucuronate isomerase [Kineosporia sp. J2-2]|uniref:5-deoxy-glucuronate isomerase n=1 Tax=Kineosporia corallincola TaxID=2835133 RepID=A0ABS5TKQ4_9ACTN|nr:5-deoxy-glucuronate isomerase [Kineosporia corallincola]MBT0771687.1 5-deoxy-glucuronate isomerase [Kineosporia corallincola]